MTRWQIASLALALAAVAVPASAQSPAGPERQGRYSMAPVEGGGFARLDTVTGAMAVCQRRDSDWVCRDMDDQGGKLREENAQLAKENRELKDEIKKLEDFVVAQGKPSPESSGFRLPTEEDVDKAMSYVERMLKKFRDKFKELEADKRSTPL